MLAEATIIDEKNRRTAMIAPHTITIFLFGVCV